MFIAKYLKQWWSHLVLIIRQADKEVILRIQKSGKTARREWINLGFGHLPCWNSFSGNIWSKSTLQKKNKRLLSWMRSSVWLSKIMVMKQNKINWKSRWTRSAMICLICATKVIWNTIIATWKVSLLKVLFRNVSRCFMRLN